jgi:hypothetical protein
VLFSSEASLIADFLITTAFAVVVNYADEYKAIFFLEIAISFSTDG